MDHKTNNVHNHNPKSKPNPPHHDLNPNCKDPTNPDTNPNHCQLA